MMKDLEEREQRLRANKLARLQEMEEKGDRDPDGTARDNQDEKVHEGRLRRIRREKERGGSSSGSPAQL